MTTVDKPLQQALAIAGGFSGLARVAGVSYQAVSKLTRVPPTRVLLVEAFTKIPREVVRPDIYPPSREKRRT